LLKALPSSHGTIRDDLLEILAKYDDPRKLPVFLSLLKPFHCDNETIQIVQQLAHLGAPAAQAILAGCEDTGEGYPEWAAKVLNDMDNIGLPFIIEALLSDDDCRREIGRPGLQWALGEADPKSVLNADIRLASARLRPILMSTFAERRNGGSDHGKDAKTKSTCRASWRR
jgi:hypothetical protein